MSEQLAKMLDHRRMLLDQIDYIVDRGGPLSRDEPLMVHYNALSQQIAELKKQQP